MAISRRAFLIPLLGLGGAAVALDLKFNPHTSLAYAFPSSALPPTPDCVDHDHHRTAALTEGPFYKRNTPERSMLRDAATIGTPLTLRGRVFAQDCRPIAGAVLDVWNCDGNGVYDNDGFRLRGHQFTDANGAFAFETVKPKDYVDFGVHRTPHIHVKVQGRETRLLTTQLFFPNEPYNARDWFYRDDLLVQLDRGTATFNFVL
jgi:protocatechuate 3,4-dioxygenase beta subunit